MSTDEHKRALVQREVLCRIRLASERIRDAIVTRPASKVCEHILNSSVWLESDETRLVWFTLLGLARQDGHVKATLIALAARARVSLAATKRALARLLELDAGDESDGTDRRLLETVSDGWRLVNYHPMTIIESRATKRERQRTHNARRANANRPTQNAFMPSGDRSLRLTSMDPHLGLSVSDPDPDPDLSLKGLDLPRAPAVSDPSAAMVTTIASTGVRRNFVPDDWLPKDRHLGRCEELRLKLDEQVAAFRLHEFERGYSDWDRAFDRWLVKAKVIRETENSRASANGGSRNRRNEPKHHQPSCGVTGFENVKNAV